MAKQTHISLLSALHGHPFAITEAGLRMIVAIAGRQVIDADLLREYRQQDQERPPSCFMALAGERIDGSRRLRMREKGVAVLAVRGPMIRHADLFEEYSGATSMAAITQEVGFAVRHPEIMSLVLDIESPGGEIPADLADSIREASEIKPIVPYIPSWGMSAAYWTALGGKKIVAHPTAHTGSVGVRATFVDTSKADEADGVQVIEMMASQSPDKIADPTTDEGRVLIQRILDSTAEDFIDYAAQSRKVSRKRVLSDFGRGAAVHARRAAEVGMIDSLDTIEGVIAAVGGGRRYRSTKTSVAASAGSPTHMAMTFKSFLAALGYKPEDPMPSSAAEPTPDVVQSRDPQTPDSDDAAELRRQLEVERQRNRDLTAEKDRNSLTAQQDRVKTWVKAQVGTRIHPAERSATEKIALSLLSTDRTHGSTLLADYQAAVESRPVLQVTEESVAAGKVPAGGRVVDPPVAPEAPETPDPWRAAREAMVKQASPEGRAASNGAPR
jgi:ClpP class serine protease